MHIWGYEQPLNNHHHFYNNMLKILRVYLPPMNTTFITKCGFTNSATEFGILQLAVSLFPRGCFTEILAILEWSLVMNKVILENLTALAQSLGAFALDDTATRARLEEYTKNIDFCREVIQTHSDEATAQGEAATYASRFSTARHACRRITADMTKQLLDAEMRKSGAGGVPRQPVPDMGKGVAEIGKNDAKSGRPQSGPVGSSSA